MDDLFGGTVLELLSGGIAALAARASEHPVVVITGVIAMSLTLLVTRNLLILNAVAFFVIAAIAGTEPVTDPLARLAFPIGTFAAIGLVLISLRLQQRRIAKLRAGLARLSATISKPEEDPPTASDRPPCNPCDQVP